MRLALLSDIHGNLHALDAVLSALDARTDVDATYHLGDLVGYGSRPNEVVARLDARAIHGVAGNYDTTVALGHAHCGCRAEGAEQEALAHASYAWTRAAVTESVRRRLAALPARLDLRPLGAHAAGPTVALVHATPASNLVYVTADRSDDFLRRLAAQAALREGDTLCFGHTHVPWHRVVDGVLFVNTGSVGRPKDGDPRAGFVLLDVGDGAPRAEVVRVAYDVEAAARGVVEAGLPAALASFLRSGGGADAAAPDALPAST